MSCGLSMADSHASPRTESGAIASLHVNGASWWASYLLESCTVLPINPTPKHHNERKSMHRRLRLAGLVLTAIAIAIAVQTPASAKPVGPSPDPRPTQVTLPHAFSAFPGYYQVVNKRSGKCLEVQTPDGFYVHQWSCLNSQEQAWQPPPDVDAH